MTLTTTTMATSNSAGAEDAIALQGDTKTAGVNEESVRIDEAVAAATASAQEEVADAVDGGVVVVDNNSSPSSGVDGSAPATGASEEGASANGAAATAADAAGPASPVNKNLDSINLAAADEEDLTKGLMTGGDGVAAVALEAENDEGNIEYKLKLVEPTEQRFQHLVSQMQFRLGEGQGEAIYEIGVEDSGEPKGLSESDMAASISTLERMAAELNAECTVLRSREGQEGLVAEVLVRKVADEQFHELRVAVVGNVDSGKSTLLGVLTRGGLDNGRGLARLNVFRHKHEVESGRTSSISQEIMGFDARGTIVNYSSMRGTPSWSEICEAASKVVTFIDLAGHERYLKTTLFGLTGHAPDFCMMSVGANMGVVGMAKEHLGIALALKVPVFIVVTKIDICPPNVLKRTMDQLTKLLKSPGTRKVPILVRGEDDVFVAARSFVSERICPIFQVSNVTGDCLDLLRMFLNLLPARKEWEVLNDDPSEFIIDDSFSVTGVGTVVSGTVMAGTISVNESLLLGPNKFGTFEPVTIKSIQAKRMPVKSVRAGHTAAFALKKVKRSSIRKGMCLMAPSLNPRATMDFEAEILVLYHSTTIALNYQAVVHCGTTRQAAKIVHMDCDVLRTGKKAHVIFRFMYKPEFLKIGARLLFREGRTKGIGKVSRVLFDGWDESEAAAVDGGDEVTPASAGTTAATLTGAGSGGTTKGIGSPAKRAKGKAAAAAAAGAAGGAVANGGGGSGGGSGGGGGGGAKGKGKGKAAR